MKAAITSPSASFRTWTARTCAATAAMTAALSIVAGPARAEWRWVEDPPQQTDTTVYQDDQPQPYVNEQPAPSETRIYEERRESPAYYAQRPRTYYRRTETVAPAPVVVTDEETFRDGSCDVTRTFLSDGSSKEQRVCSRLMTPHEFFIDRMGRHFDRLRGY